MNIRKESFLQSPLAGDLRPGLISATQFREAILRLNVGEFSRFLRSYVEEGVPAAFYGAPIIWEGVRDFVASRLRVSVKGVTIVGSGKTGFSCSPSNFGNPFSSQSDLDFSVIDEYLFQGIERDARKFVAAVGGGGLKADSDKGQARWLENSRILSRGLRFGFIDSKLIPSYHDDFPASSKVNNEASILFDRLIQTGYSIKAVSFRVFSSWEAFSSRVQVNYAGIKKKLNAE